jgi:hypothetical protein
MVKRGRTQGWRRRNLWEQEHGQETDLEHPHPSDSDVCMIIDIRISQKQKHTTVNT